MSTADQYYSFPLPQGLTTDGQPTPVGPYSYWKVKTFSLVGSKNPAWRIKVAKHQDASSYYTCRRVTGTGMPILTGHTTQHYKGKTYGWTVGPYCPSNFIMCPSTDFVFPTNDYTAAADAYVRDKVRRKANDFAGTFNAVVPLAEAGDVMEVIHTFRTATAKLFHALLALKAGNPVRLLELASELWLTYAFGIAPLVSDIASISKAISWSLRNKQTCSFHGLSDEYTWCSSGPAATFSWFGANWKCLPAYFYSYSARCDAGTLIRPDSANDWNRLHRLSLDLESILRNSASTAWELTPFSWVIDYFFDIGDYLDAVFYTLPGNTTYICATTKKTVRVVSQTWVTGCSPQDSTFVWDEYPSVDSPINEYYLEVIERTPLTSLAHSGVRMRLMKEMSNFGFSKLANLASVAVMLNAGRRSLHP